MATLLLAGALVAFAFRSLGRGKESPADVFWGPLDFAGGFNQIQFSLLQSVAVLAALALVFWISPLRRRWRHRLEIVLLLIVALDLGLSARGMLHTIPIERENSLLAALPHDPTPESTARWLRTQNAGGWPRLWRRTHNVHRQSEVEASLRGAWFGRWHLADRQAVLNNMTSIRSHEMSLFWTAAAQVTEPMSGQERDSFWQQTRSWLAIGGVAHCGPDSITVNVDGSQAVLGVTRRKLRPSESFQFTTEAVDAVDPLNPLEQTRRLLLQDRQPGRHAFRAETETVREQPELVEVELETDRRGTLSRACFQDGHWNAEISEMGTENWKAIKVQKFELLKQAVEVPAGHWRIRFIYQPAWLSWSIGIAVIAWSGVMLRLVAGGAKSR